MQKKLFILLIIMTCFTMRVGEALRDIPLVEGWIVYEEKEFRPDTNPDGEEKMLFREVKKLYNPGSLYVEGEKVIVETMVFSTFSTEKKSSLPMIGYMHLFYELDMGSGNYKIIRGTRANYGHSSGRWIVHPLAREELNQIRTPSNNELLFRVVEKECREKGLLDEKFFQERKSSLLY